MCTHLYVYMCLHGRDLHGREVLLREVGGWGRDPFSRNFMKPTPRRKWYLTTGRRFHSMVLDPIPQSLPVHFFGSRPQPPTSPYIPTPTVHIHTYTNPITYTTLQPLCPTYTPYPYKPTNP